MNNFLDVGTIEIRLTKAHRKIEIAIGEPEDVPQVRAELSDLVDVEARIGVEDGFKNLVKNIAVVRRCIAESPVVAWKLVVKRAFGWELECVFDVTVVALNE